MTTILKQESIIANSTTQLKVQKEDLLRALTTVLGAVGTKNTLPILNNVLIQTDGPDKILLTATDLELGVRTKCPATVALQGSVTAPARKLYEIIRELAPGDVEITVAKNSAVNIKAGKSFFKIMGLESDDFPKLPEPTSGQSFELDQQVLKQCLTLTSFAISRDEARYTLNGVLAILRNNTARFVATDGKRLASIEKEVELPKDLVLEAIVPAKTLLELNKTLSEGGNKVKIISAQNQILFQVQETLLISRLIEGKFPSYEQVIPKEEKTVAQMDRQELLSALKRAALFTSQENQSAKLDFIEGKLLISSRSPNLGEAKEEVQAKVSGEDVTIGFNPNYIIDALKNLDCEQISFCVTEPDKPGLIKTGDGYLYVVMPMQLG
ncbi:MAG: DNA polymerase III subunit beta [Omnitrophica bacterium RIFCSPHIGHO2_02_FULL_46_11]|nr:MAG: DNA polymerase III subunit beta [Omnitrophica bacterium RIFCSPHIGHO2_02_FULL_46_11]OGW87447.1 MAG: DNA polymerase III subunit beta [Omnitrophica bacterium RIFCSPLOWO2_01_FULL_45_10b]